MYELIFTCSESGWESENQKMHLKIIIKIVLMTHALYLSNALHCIKKGV